MATPDVIAEPHVQRRRHFATWVRKLTNFKSSSEADRGNNKVQDKKARRGTNKLNNPYPQSGSVGCPYYNGESSYSFTAAQSQAASSLSFDPSERGRWSSEDHPPRSTAAGGGRGSSIAWTENHENHENHENLRQSIAPSHAASSLAGTSRTIGGQGSRRGGDSTFSSPAPSVQSLATTLTTIQSTIAHPHGNIAPSVHSNAQSIHFSQPFPNMATVSALPAHRAHSSSSQSHHQHHNNSSNSNSHGHHQHHHHNHHHHPTTYSTATANNLLTDDASILTLASSSKRRRRRSMDTDASVRALAPSSVWGGSRESLPLSVLSANIDPSNMNMNAHSNPRLAAERSSIYSATGVVPATGISSTGGERGGGGGAYPRQGDGGSVRSGRLGHGRPDSISGSVALASPREVSDEGSGEDDDEQPSREY